MKKRLSVIIVSVLFALILVVPAFASETLVYDNASLLTVGEVEALNETLYEIWNKHKENYVIDVAVLTTDNTDGYDTQTYADLFANENLATNNIILCINMGDRAWHISTAGECISIFTDSILESMGDRIVPYLSNGDFASAFNEFASEVDYYITAYENGETVEPNTAEYSESDYYDTAEYSESLENYAVRIFMGLAVGVVAGLIGKGVLKSQLKSVHAQNTANNYVRKNSLNITRQQDMYLYSTVSRVAKPKSNSSGSSTHSTGGVSHGGTGGHF